ncbi:hypothetical protein [Lyngbya sp. PCC 8106]|uniref:hypothetical protein n=1 Tax=Lyngbya sp. (strain PCC 8106) TaxID=313612 RepID=UPI0000EA903F|nr:hypothetical protein [Lyngbya sp. PCC 8106]EAW35251.1 hypothetical protein L8106_15979 [Lyngbya sp. PCC 8106]
MDTGLLSGLLLAFVNGMICLVLPLILAATQRKRQQAEDLTALSPSFNSSELISQEVN